MIPTIAQCTEETMYTHVEPSYYLRCIQGTGIQVPLQSHCLPDTLPGSRAIATFSLHYLGILPSTSASPAHSCHLPGFLWSYCPVKSNYLIASLGQLFQGKMSILSKYDLERKSRSLMLSLSWVCFCCPPVVISVYTG